MAEGAAMQAANSAVTRIDARPFRATSTDTSWDRAVSVRDTLAKSMRAALDELKFKALVFVSSNGNYPPWVKLEAWLPEPPAKGGVGNERVELVLVVDVKPYHESELVVSAYATRGKRKLNVTNRPDFTVNDVRDWTLYTLRCSGKPANYTPIKDGLHRLVKTLLPFLRGPHANRVERKYRNRLFLSGLGLLGVLSAALILLPIVVPAVGYYAAFPALLTLIGLSGLIVVYILAHRRKHAVFVTEQPMVPPRNAGLVDSWHAVVAELGRDYANVRRRLVERLKEEERSADLTCQMEIYGYRTPNGYEERERLVISKGQCFVHVHIYPFADDVFVGWDAYLNWAKWDETVSILRKAEWRLTTEFRELRQGYYVPNQFDLIDLNSLSELVHRCLEREIKAMLKEKAIDQEIDFRIIRGDRDAALDQSRHGDASKSRPAWQYVSGQAM
jgi:hypothetical protein